MKKSPLIAPLLGSIALLLAPAQGIEIAKLPGTTALNVTTAWSGGVVPTSADVMLWNNLYTTPGASTTLSQLGADLSVLGLKVTNVGGAANAANTQVGFQNTSSANTLTIGAGGIDMSAATQALLLQSKILLGADQTWSIANANTGASASGFNNGEDLSFQGQSGTATTATTTFNLGGRTVTTTGAGTGFISSGMAVANGTINIGNTLFMFAGGNTRAVTVGSDVTLNVAAGSTLHFQSNSGTVTSSAAITLNGGTLKLVSNNAANLVTINGSVNVATASALLVGNNVGNGSVAGTSVNLNANLTGSAALTVTNSASTATPLFIAGNNSAYSGTLTFGGTAGRVSRLTSANAGSAAATWSISSGHTLQVNGLSVALGTLNGAGTVNSFSGTSTINVGAGTFSGTLTNGAGTLALTKNTAGTLTISGTTSNYTGATNVNVGTLLVAPGALSGTTVNVASGATYTVQTAVSGLLNTPVVVADGGTILARPLAAGINFSLPSLSVGTATGGSIVLDTGVLGNPFFAPITATAFSASAGSKIKVIGSNLAPGTFSAVDYSGVIGGGGFGALSLVLPFRITGGLVDNAGISVDVNITGTAKPAWNGNVNGNWNIDNVGDGSAGTANWLAASGPNTYVEAGVGTDSVVFDDTATGGTNVNLTTTLTPGGVSVANTALSYTFSGTGRITGGGALTKDGTGTLAVTNTGTNDFTGGTFINDGTVTLGDGVTAGVGTLGTAAVTVNSPGKLEFNRPDAFTFANAISGTGGLKKSQASTATLSAATTLSGPVNLAAGTLRFTAGGNLSGAITGAGALTAAGGTLQLSGNDANTFTGLTTVSSGTLQLNKTPGVDAVGGSILITGTGILAPLQPNQIPDTATITYDKTGTNQGNVTFGNETIAALTLVNGHDTGSQVLGNNGLVVTGLLTAGNTSVFSVASGQSSSAGGLSVSGTATIRIAGNSGATTLSVGTLGITANGGLIQVGQGTGAFDAVLNLDGDVTTTGNLSFTDGNFTGANLRQINIGAGTRTFSIGTGTTTTVAPDIAGTGGITKTGNGTLQLTAASASTYTGPTTVSAGTFLTTTAQTGGAGVSVAGGATFGVTLATAGATFLSSDVTTGAASTLQLATGTFGNPAVPVLAAGAFAVNGATTIRLTGSALATGTGIPLIGYTSLGGVSGFGGLSVSLPTRMAGTLVNNVVDSRVDIDLSVEQAKWNGNVNGNWDIDADGTGGTGTLNWLTTVANTPTRYFQGPPISTDTANFDDTATGTTTVTLTTAITPAATNVGNVTTTYTFTGPGTLTGATALNKTGAGTLILKNTAAYNHTGGTILSGGTLQVGDGVTPGAGLLPTTAVTNNANIAMNRPDDFAVTTTISGTGTIIKQNTNTTTFTLPTTYGGGVQVNAGTLLFSGAANLSGTIGVNAATLQLNGGGPVSGSTSINGGGLMLLSISTTVSGPVAINSGKLRFANGGTLSGAVSGAGEFEVGGGTVVVSGAVASTATGLTTISGGTLQLNRPGVTAIAGDILITGGGVLAIIAADQIADTATITFNGTSTDATVGSTGAETVANLISNPSVNTGQFQLRNGFTVTGMATLNQGVLGVSSGHTSTLNALTMTGGIFRIAGNAGASVMNIGAGGITASGGDIQVKFNTANMDATLNLGGNVTTTGNVTFTNGGYTGANLNVINLTATRTFDIAAATTTTVAPDIAGAGGLTKAGNGTLSLLAGSAGTYGGATTINAGTLAIAGGAAIPDTSAVSLANVAGAMLLLNASETIGSLGGGGAAGGEVALGGNTLTVGDATPATVFAGAISGATGTVFKQGTGALTLSGVQTYGTLTATAGTTNVNSALGTGASTLNANATVNINASQTLAALNIGAGAVVTFGAAAPFAGDGGKFGATAVVPEPASAMLLLGGAAMLGLRRRRLA